MILQSIISQGKNYEDFLGNPDFSWGGADNGNYPDTLNPTKVFLVIPDTINVNTYHHHPIIEEHNNAIHVMYSTTNADEENAGMYVWYQKSYDYGLNWTNPVTLIEPQDDLTKDVNTQGGRVVIPSAFSIINNELYCVCDVNDRSSINESNPRTRDGVGVLARKINNNETFGDIYWIENIDSSFNPPANVVGYPSYLFNETLRQEIRNYFINNPDKRPRWYYSVSDVDILYSEFNNFNSGYLTEPSIVKMPNNQYLKMWRYVGGSLNKFAQTSDYGNYFNSPYETNIPDSPSVTEIYRLNNNEICIVGNNKGTSGISRSPLYFAISTDGFNYESNDIYNVDSETSGPNFPGLNKNTGVAYPDIIQMSNNKIIVVYSVNKEDIKVSIFDKPTI